MAEQNRFIDQKKRFNDFQTEVAVYCPKCKKKALATVDYEEYKANLFCSHCGYHERTSTEIMVQGMKSSLRQNAAYFFNVDFWYVASFKNDFFFAFNEAHLLYLEQYIGAKLRERKDRSHFTLLERLPKFYHEAKNRDALLKIIEKLKKK